jgi:hypothetical protein
MGAGDTGNGPARQSQRSVAFGRKKGGLYRVFPVAFGRVKRGYRSEGLRRITLACSSSPGSRPTPLRDATSTGMIDKHYGHVHAHARELREAAERAA